VPARLAVHLDPLIRSTRSRTTVGPSARALLLAAGVGAGLALAPACSSSTAPSISEQTIPNAPTTIDAGAAPTRTLAPNATGPHSTVSIASRATVDSFQLPAKLTCDVGQDLTVTATYTTSRATEVVFVVDETQVPGNPPTSGSFDVPLHCDGNAHTVVISAIDDAGHAATSAKAILTGTPAKGD
jgi:hypothetical protein